MMTLFRSLRDAFFEAIDDIDHVVDDAGNRLDQVVVVRIERVAGEITGALDGARSGLGPQFGDQLRLAVAGLDDRYQRFMVEHVDPLFGRARTAQLAELGGTEISPMEKFLNRGLAFAAGAFIVVVVGGAIVPGSLIVSVPLSLTLMLPVYQSAIATVKAQRRVTYNVVTAINVTGAWLLGFYRPALLAMFLYYVHEKLLKVTEDRSQNGLVEVFSKQPRTVWRWRDGVAEELPFEHILPDDVIVVDAGAFMPVDGTVVDGLASLDQQMLTGEAQPVEKSPGDVVYASTMVLAGRLHVRVDKSGDQTVAAKIGEVLGRTASYQLALQSRGYQLSNKFAVPTLAGGALALVTLGPQSGLAILNSSFGTSVRISGPVSMLNLLNIASRNAILLKDGRSLELLSDVDTVLFDKTGTLTLGQPHVAAVYRAGAFDEDRLLTFAAAAEHRQTHPIALAISAEAAARGISLPDTSNARYEVGYGIKVELEGHTIQVGSDRFMHLLKIAIPDDLQARRAASHAQGHSFILIAVDGKLAGGIDLQPTIRPEAGAVIHALRERGLKLMIVSGDQEEPTRRLAETLGLDRHFANVLPESKAALVEQLQAEGRTVCFVGDGINDAIALKKANVSVSLRGATTVATDVAQVVLMQESLQQLPYLFVLGEDMKRTLKLSLAAGIIPGAINVAGVFLLGWGFFPSAVLGMASVIASMGISMYPSYKYRELLAPQGDPATQAAGVPHAPRLLPAPV